MATTQSREFRIALCGFGDREQKALGSAFKLSEARPRRYLRWESGFGRPDVGIINEDLPTGRQAWLEMRRELSGANFPLLRVGIVDRASALFDDVEHVFIKRPVLAIRILKALDELVTEVYQFAPELSIHDNMATHGIAGLPEFGQQVSEFAKRILVVDDSESVRKMMEVRLTLKGYAVDFAMTGEEALIRVRERSYDLIFLDVMLPGINGYEVSRHLKRHLQVPAPVVMLTGRTSRIDKLRGSLASADAYLTKPLTIDSLNETLQRYLK